MDVDTAPSLTELINLQLGMPPDRPLARGVAVPPDVLWSWVGEALAPAALMPDATFIETEYICKAS